MNEVLLKINWYKGLVRIWISLTLLFVIGCWPLGLVYFFGDDTESVVCITYVIMASTIFSIGLGAILAWLGWVFSGFTATEDTYKL